MNLTGDQRCFLTILGQTGFVRPDQVLPLLRINEPGKEPGHAEAMLRRLRYLGLLSRSSEGLICLPEFRDTSTNFGNRQGRQKKTLMAMLPSLLKNRSPRSGDGNGKSTVGGSQKRRNAAQPTSVTRLFKGFGTLPNKQKQRFPAPPEIAVSSLCGFKETHTRKP